MLIIVIGLFLTAISSRTWRECAFTKRRALHRTKSLVSSSTMAFTKDRTIQIISTWANILCCWWLLVNARFRPDANYAASRSWSLQFGILEVILTWPWCFVSYGHERVCSCFHSHSNAILAFRIWSFFKILTRSWGEIFNWGTRFVLEVLTLGRSLSACTLCSRRHWAKLR